MTDEQIVRLRRAASVKRDEQTCEVLVGDVLAALVRIAEADGLEDEVETLEARIHNLMLAE